MDSVLKTVTKLKSLQRELKNTYKDESAASLGPQFVAVFLSVIRGTYLILTFRSCKTLQDHIEKLEKEYDELNDETCKGEQSNFGTEPVP